MSFVRIVVEIGIAVGVVCILVAVLRIGWYLTISKRLGSLVTKFERRTPLNPAPQRILFIGDSTGYGVGASHQRYSIVGRIGADFPEAYIENCSSEVPDAYLSKVRTILRTKAEEGDSSMQYDLIIIMVGGMDVVIGTPLSMAHRTLREAIRYGKRCAREIVLVSPNNTGLAPAAWFPAAQIYQWRARHFRDLYEDIAREEEVRHVSLFEECGADEISKRNLYAPDQTHPNDEGYGIWYDKILKEAIAAALKRP